MNYNESSDSFEFVESTSSYRHLNPKLRGRVGIQITSKLSPSQLQALADASRQVCAPDYMRGFQQIEECLYLPNHAYIDLVEVARFMMAVAGTEFTYRTVV